MSPSDQMRLPNNVLRWPAFRATSAASSRRQRVRVVHSRPDSIEVHLVSRLNPLESAPSGYPEFESEGESLTTPKELVLSRPTP